MAIRRLGISLEELRPASMAECLAAANGQLALAQARYSTAAAAAAARGCTPSGSLSAKA
jgi:hypothetical protein